jgi:putative hydrolase of the HAD superfamily
MTSARGAPRLWLFDLDDTLHDATSAAMDGLRIAMGTYIEQQLGLTADEAHALRRRYWLRYGATLLGLVKHHAVDAAHFLHVTHQLPGLEERVRGRRHDLEAIRRLPGRKVVLTNAPAAYAARVLQALAPRGARRLFDAVVSIEDMWMFGDLRPKPDARMLRRLAARLGTHPARCTLVEDTLVHQKAARRIGMQTVWMQRWLPTRPPAAAASPVVHHVARHRRRPAYVDRRLRCLRELRHLHSGG